MKITQNDTQLTLQSSGGGSLAFGAFFFIIGAVVAIVIPLVSKNAGGAIIFGILFAVIGGVLALLASSRTVILNKNGTSTIANRRIIGAKEQDQTFNTADVTGVSLTTGMTGGGMNGMNGAMRNGSNRISTLVLTMKDNAILQLAAKSSGSGLMVNGISTSMIQKAPLSKEAQAVATFLNVPLQESNVTNPIAAVESLIGAFRGQQSPVPPESIVTPPPTPQAPPVVTQVPPQDTPPTVPPTV